MPAASLVTGGAGFVGSHLVSRLLADGRSVVLLDDLSAEGAQAPASHPGLRFIRGDVRDPAAVADALTGCDTVFHLAALISVPRSLERPGLTQEINVAGTQLLLDQAASRGVKTVVFASSCAVYGAPQSLPITEDVALHPLSPYAQSKREGEELGAAWTARSEGRAFVALRLFNIYGPGQGAGGPYASAVAAFVDAARAGRAARIDGDGEQTRDFISVDDVVDVFLAASSGSRSGVFNVGTGRGTSINELWERVKATVGGARAGDERVDRRPQRKGDIRHSVADVSRIEQQLGWRARRSLDDGLARLVASLDPAA